MKYLKKYILPLAFIIFIFLLSGTQKEGIVAHELSYPLYKKKIRNMKIKKDNKKFEQLKKIVAYSENWKEYEKNIKDAGLYNWAKRIYPIDEDWNVSLHSIFRRGKRIKN